MGVQPPSNDIESEPDVVEFGIAALAATLESREVDYPVTADRLAREHGHLTVPVDASGHEIRLEQALEKTSTDEFDSEADLLDALHPVFESEREAVSRSVVAQLRGLLPF
jgi:hypothetical protein